MCNEKEYNRYSFSKLAKRTKNEQKKALEKLKSSFENLRENKNIFYPK